MKPRRSWAMWVALAALGAVTAVTVAVAAGSSPWWYVIGSGGGGAVSSGSALQGTIGQPLTGESTGAGLHLKSGFWSRWPLSAPTPDGTAPTPGGTTATPASATPASATPGTPAASSTPTIGAEPSATPGGASRWTVNTADDEDDGTCDAAHCSLREAIQAANLHLGPDVVAFAIPAADPGCDGNGVCTIRPTMQTAELQDSETTIDGFTQPGARPNNAPLDQPVDAVMRVVLDGSELPEGSYAHGLVVRSGGNVVRGLAIHGFGNGIDTIDAAGNRFEGNFIGVAADGRTVPGNKCNGIALGGIQGGPGSANNVIGGGLPAARNVLAGNGCTGVSIGPLGHNIVRGNFIGTDATGKTGPGNAVGGVRLFSASDNAIGGENDGDGNVIAFNRVAGVIIVDRAAPANGNTVRRNSIHDNDGRGIQLEGGANARIGAPVIAHATTAGVAGTACAGCTVEVFSDSGNEGAVYEGVTTADAAGRWSLSGTYGFTGPNLTATATDGQGNTSTFAVPALLSKSGIWLPWVGRRHLIQ